MSFRIRYIVISIVAAAALGLGITRSASAAPPTPGQVKVNEFMPAPSSGSEWVELYNTTNATLDIGGMFIDDIAGGGGAAKVIPAGTTIAPNGYYVMLVPPALNNTGDDVRLLGTDGTTVHDTKTYTTVVTDKTWCRKPDGSTWDSITCNPTQGATNGGGGSTWTPGNLEIHVLNVGQGESQLIIGPTGRTLLIGVFEAGWNSNQGAAFTASEIRRITGGSHVNYIMPSHWHLDHMGYATQGGIWSLLEEQGITADAIIDRDGGVWNDANSDGLCDPDTEVVWHNAGTVSGTGRNWVCWATNPNTAGGAIRQIAQLNSTTQIDLGIGSGVTTKIVGVDAQGVLQLNGQPVGGDHTAEAVPPSENDYSITIWLKWGQFDFVAGGDSDGEYATSEFGYTYNDVESVVAARINQPVEVAWVNHHGSSHSSSSTWVNTLSPQAVAFSCGTGNSYGHPGQNVLDEYGAEGTWLYFTQPCDQTRTYPATTRVINGNIEIKVTNGVNYTINGDPYVASSLATATPTATNTPTATPTPTPTATRTPTATATRTPTVAAPRAPVSGEVVINEFLPAPQTLFTTEWVELYNKTSVTLIIGGLWIDDINNGGGAPVQIPAGTTIAPNGFYVMNFTNFLNNSSDTVRLLATNGSTQWDTKSYTTWQYDKSWCRKPNGSTWSSTVCTATKGTSN